MSIAVQTRLGDEQRVVQQLILAGMLESASRDPSAGLVGARQCELHRRGQGGKVSTTTLAGGGGRCWGRAAVSRLQQGGRGVEEFFKGRRPGRWRTKAIVK